MDYWGFYRDYYRNRFPEVPTKHQAVEGLGVFRWSFRRRLDDVPSAHVLSKMFVRRRDSGSMQL